MGRHIRDERPLKALTGLSQAAFDHLLPVFSEVYTAQHHQQYAEGVVSGTRTRQPGGGAKGKLPTPTDKLVFVLYDSKTYPTFEVFGTQWDMVRSQAHENLEKLSPVFHKTLVRFEMRPHRAFTTPAECKAALQGVDRVSIEATERASRRSQDEATQRDYYRGKKKRLLEKIPCCPFRTHASCFSGEPAVAITMMTKG